MADVRTPADHLAELAQKAGTSQHPWHLTPATDPFGTVAVIVFPVKMRVLVLANAWNRSVMPIDLDVVHFAIRHYGAFMGQVLTRKPVDERLRADARRRRIALIQPGRPSDVREFLLGDRAPGDSPTWADANPV